MDRSVNSLAGHPLSQNLASHDTSPVMKNTTSLCNSSEDDVPTLIPATSSSIEEALAEKDGQNKPGEFDPPNGGAKAWSTVFGCSLISLSTFGLVNAFGVFIDFYKQEYLSNYSPTLISMIGSVQVFVLYLLACIAGGLFDALGPKPLILFSGFVVPSSLFMLSLTKPQQIYQQYLTQALLFNFGAAVSFFPAISIMAHWFTTKTPYTIGAVAAAASVGGIVYPIMLHHTLPAIGFGWSVRILAFFSLFCFIIAYLTVFPRRPTKPLPPVWSLVDFEAFKDPCFTLLAIGNWLSIFSIFNPMFYVGLYGTAVSGGQSKLAPYFLSLLCAGAIPGRVGPGLIAPYVGRFNTLYISTLISAILILAMWYTAPDDKTVAAFGTLYGFFSGPFFSLGPACVATISPIDKVGGRIGMMFAFMSTGALAGTPVGGVFIKQATVEHFKKLILFSGIMGLAGSFFLFLARIMRDRRIFAIV